MFINSLKLESYRNYISQDISFINGINLFIGNNAQGKTNILESIYLLSFLKSYRTHKDNELINFNCEFLRVNSNFNKNNEDINIEIYVDNDKKIAKKNNVVIKKITDYIGDVLIVIFSPDDLNIIKLSPTYRRKFIDNICCQLSKNYTLNLLEYNKTVKIKNNLLKNNNIDINYLKILNEKLSKNIVYIVKYRDYIIEKINNFSNKYILDLTNNKEKIDIKYISEYINKSFEDVNKILNNEIKNELFKKYTLKGIHKEDIYISINENEVCKYGSQGQIRTSLLVMKLATLDIIKEEKNETPILLLDDITSELDNERINFLLKNIKNCQSVITATNSDFVKNVENIQIIKIKDGRLENI